MLVVNTEYHVIENGILVYVNLYKDDILIKKIYYEFFGDVLPKKNIVNDFAVVAIMPYAMENGFDLHIKGAVHAELLKKMEESQDAWLRWHPTLFKKISISAEIEVASILSEAQDAVIAYSGGLDSTYALHAHAKKLLGRRSCKIVAGVLICGFDIPLNNAESFDIAKQYTGNILRSYGVGQVTVRTNWRELDTSWEETHMFGVVSVISQFSSSVSRGVIASDFPYDDESLGWGSNTVTNQLFSLSSFPLEFTGGALSRTDKAKALSNEQVILENLRVCYQGVSGNCGKCGKCNYTKLNFLAIGVAQVPSMGEAITKKQIKRLYLKDQKSIERMRNVLKHGDWLRFPDEKAVFERRVRRGPKKNTLFMLFAKYKRSILKRVPFVVKKNN